MFSIGTPHKRAAGATTGEAPTGSLYAAMHDTRNAIHARLEGEEATLELGRIIGTRGAPGLVLALEGDLGCGKTTLVRGIGEGLGIEGGVASPTYTLMQSHAGGRLPLAHFDSWMEGREKALLADGADEFLQSDGIAVVEWASRVEDWLPRDRVAVRLHHETLQSRRVEIAFLGDVAPSQGHLVEALRAAYPPAPGQDPRLSSPRTGANSPESG